MVLRTFVSIALLSGRTYAQSPARPLSCDVNEAIALKTAPLGAGRVSEHELRVRWRNGTRVFRDSAVVAGDLGGIDYRYCGYDPVSRFHLIFKHDDAIFGGVLVEHATGRLLPAGQRVLFSPDTNRYFAAVQPDGLDGEEWHVYSVRQGQLWQGLSGISAKHPTLKYEYFIAELTNPHWSVAGDLEATLTCALRPHSEPVHLRRQGNGFAWLPFVACPPAK